MRTLVRRILAASALALGAAAALLPTAALAMEVPAAAPSCNFRP
jgi:hypothetical protein